MKIVVLISGNGSNLQAIIDNFKDKTSLTIAAVISNEADAYGLERARKANIPTHVISHHTFQTREAFDQALKDQIDHYQPDLIVLAGFMRRLGDDFVNHYTHRMINIHPSLLPKYPGLHTHKKVLDNGDERHGVSIHFVTPVLDGGPLIAQESLSVDPNDTIESLKSRIQILEHKLYPTVLKYFAEGRIKIENDTVYIDNQAVMTQAEFH